MSYRLKDKVAVVTGSGQGIGRAIALALAQEGARVVTNNRFPGTSGGDAETTAYQIKNMGGKAVPFFGDISSFESARKLIQSAIDNFGSIDILVNNGGSSNNIPNIWNMGEEDWDLCVDSYLKGSFNCTRHAAPVMKDRKWGRIINTSSISWLGVPPDCNYASAKAGIVGLTRALAVEMGNYGVTCNAFTPAAATRANSNEEIKENIRKAYEAGAMSTEQYEEMLNPPDPETIGPMIVYLCTEEASFINGQVFDINGGVISIYSKPEKTKAIFKDHELWSIEELVNLVPKILMGKD